MWIKMQKLSFTKINFKMSSVKWRPFCLGLSVLTPPVLFAATEAAHAREVKELRDLDLVAIHMGPYDRYPFACAHAAGESLGEEVTCICWGWAINDSCHIPWDGLVKKGMSPNVWLHVRGNAHKCWELNLNEAHRCSLKAEKVTLLYREVFDQMLLQKKLVHPTLLTVFCR